MGRDGYPQPCPMMWPVSLSSSAGNCRSRCSPLSSMLPCSKLRHSPPWKRGPQPFSCCLVCYLPETPPSFTSSSSSSPMSPKGLRQCYNQEKLWLLWFTFWQGFQFPATLRFRCSDSTRFAITTKVSYRTTQGIPNFHVKDPQIDVY